MGIAIFFAGCAHFPGSSDRASRPDENDPRTLSELLKRGGSSGSASTPSSGRSSGTPLVIRGITLKNTQFDIPVTINSKVEQWIDYFTGRGRIHYTRYLERSAYFIPYIMPLLRQNGLPEDLVYLSMIESGFNNFARSRAKAVGPWQFISATGKRYGLMVNWWVDERRDIRKSTLAAVEYLRDLYKMFQSWELAAAAYNAGEAKIARAIQRYGTKDFWELTRHRYLRPETRDYVPKMMAAAIIGKNPAQFGFAVPDLKPSDNEIVSGDGEVVQVIKTDKPEEELKKDGGEEGSIADLEAEAEEDYSVPERELSPATQAKNEPQGEENSQTAAPRSETALAKPVPTPHVNKKGEVGGQPLEEFEVQSPADLLQISRAAGLSYHTVKGLNAELNRWCTPPNVASYRIKLPISVKETFLSNYNNKAFPRKVEFLAHKARRGETLSHIASHYGIKVDPVTDLNGVSAHMPLRAGSKILLPLPNDRSRSLASLEVRDPPERRRYRRRAVSRPKSFRMITIKRREAASAKRESPLTRSRRLKDG